MASLVAFGLTTIGALAFGLATPSPQPDNHAGTGVRHEHAGTGVRHEHAADNDSRSDIGF